MANVQNTHANMRSRAGSKFRCWPPAMPAHITASEPRAPNAAVVERYFGHDVAQATADAMEYQGLGWLDANSNAAYAKPFESTPDHPKCLVCGMDVDAHTAATPEYCGVTYYFCIAAHKAVFDAAPSKWV